MSSQPNVTPRTHRERKEAYVAALESEVVRLRANEARLESETKALYAENKVLKTLLTQQGIPISTEIAGERHGTYNTAFSSSSSPGDSTISVSDGAPDATLTLAISQENPGTKKKNRRRQIYIQQPKARVTNPAVNFSHPISPPSSGSTLSHLASPNSIPSPSHLSELDPEALGMEFVLTLESPCLSHIDVDTSSPPSAPLTAMTTGHALNLSACLLHTHPSPAGQRLTSPSPWHVPRASLSQLLKLSSRVPLGDDEVTPIQAWEYVRQLDGFGALDFARWEALKENLVGGIKCHGFGGVLQREVLEKSVYEAFVVGRVF